MSEKREAVYSPEADKRWAEQNREHKRYLTDRTSARRFLRSKAAAEDLVEMEELIQERREALKTEEGEPPH